MVDDIDDLRIAYRQAMNTIEQITAEIERLRAAGDEMADDVLRGYESLRHWQEARRG
jgi:hypothetical protein